MAATSRSHDEDLLPISAAARTLGVSARTLRLWADSGRIRVFRGPGARRYFRRQDLLALRPSPDVPVPPRPRFVCSSCGSPGRADAPSLFTGEDHYCEACLDDGLRVLSKAGRLEVTS